MLTTCAEFPFARGVFGGSDARGARRRVGAVGCAERREVRMGLIDIQCPSGRRGWFATMSSAGLGNAGLGGRGSRNGRITR